MTVTFKVKDMTVSLDRANAINVRRKWLRSKKLAMLQYIARNKCFIRP